MYIKRAIEEKLREALGQFPVLLVTGPRQAGKSTLLKHAFQEFAYVTFDDPFMRDLAQKDPELFLSTYPSPLILDEIQYVPHLLSYLKIKVDRDRKQVRYILTGSQSFQMMKGVAESLAGRVAIFHLYPLSWEEIASTQGRESSPYNDSAMIEQTIKGFYPEFFQTPKLNPQLWHSSYITTYIERDVRNIKAILDLSRFQTFIQVLAARAGQLLNLNEIGKEVGISQPTAKDWLSLLESTYLIHIFRPYHPNITKRVIKSPKLYFVDTGLLCYLLGIDTFERFMKASERGHLFENMVVMEAIKRLSTLPARSQSYFFRTSDGLEVDLLTELHGSLSAYEIKFTKTLRLDFAEGLGAFKKMCPLKQAKVLSLNETSQKLGPEIEADHWFNGLRAVSS